MRVRLLPILLGSVLFGGAPRETHAQEPLQKLSTQNVSDEIDARINARIKESAEQVEEAIKQIDDERKVTPNPRTTKDAHAASSASSTVAPVDGPGLTEFIALAVDQGIVESEGQHQLTLNLNGQAFAEGVTQASGYDERQYRSLRPLRKLAGKVSLGGSGERFDRDGDGQADDPLSAKSLTDQVAWKVEYRLVGSRDRRDDEVAEGIFAKLRGLQKDVTGAHAKVLAVINSKVTLGDGITRNELDTLFKDPEVEGRMGELDAITAPFLDQYVGISIDLADSRKKAKEK